MRSGPAASFGSAWRRCCAWNPDWLIVQNPDALALTRTEPLWRALPALRGDRAVLLPGLPFGRMDFPPSANRLLGLIGLPVLFGARQRDGLAEAVADLWALFYHHRPEPSQVEALHRPALSPA